MADDNNLFSDSKPTPGKYKFRIAKAEQQVFSTGSHGIKLELAAQGPGGDFKVYDNLVDVPKAAWKAEQLQKALKKTTTAFPSCEDIIACEGSADLVMNDRGYLSVKRYLEPERGTAIPEASAQPKGPNTYDDIPF